MKIADLSLFNSSPCRIENGPLRTRPRDEKTPWRKLYFQSSKLPITHIDASFPGTYRIVEVSTKYREKYNRCLQFEGEILPDGVEELAALLTETLCLPAHEPFDLAMALDRYKNPEDDVDPMNWENTEIGDLVYKAKYYINSPSTQRAAHNSLAVKLSDAIQRHPLYRDAPYLVSVPGSSGDGASAGEMLAAQVAQNTGQKLISTIGPRRASRKNDSSLDVSGIFELPTMLDAPCVVLDDVWMSGTTIREVGRIAKRAGAPHVYGLAAAKTMRN